MSLCWAVPGEWALGVKWDKDKVNLISTDEWHFELQARTVTLPELELEFHQAKLPFIEVYKLWCKCIPIKNNHCRASPTM